MFCQRNRVSRTAQRCFAKETGFLEPCSDILPKKPSFSNRATMFCQRNRVSRTAQRCFAKETGFLEPRSDVLLNKPGGLEPRNFIFKNILNYEINITFDVLKLI